MGGDTAITGDVCQSTTYCLFHEEWPKSREERFVAWLRIRKGDVAPFANMGDRWAQAVVDELDEVRAKFKDLFGSEEEP
jgi:hypothetical protein